MSLTPSHPRALWLDRFALQLGELVQCIDADTAYRHVMETFDDAADLPPEEAAAIFADELPPADLGVHTG